MTDTTTAHILIIDHIPAQAEALADYLRRTRLPMRIRAVSKINELAQTLRGDNWHVVIWSMQSGGIELDTVMAALSEHGTRTPVIAVLRKYFREVALDCFKLGVVDVLAADDLDLIVARATREFQIGQCEWARAVTEEDFGECNQRFEHLLASMAQPVAFLHFGSFIKYNPPFQSLLGLPESDTLEGESLLDLVDLDERDSLKRELNDLCEGRLIGRPIRRPLHFLNRSADAPPLHVELSACEYNGEPCIQLMVELAVNTPAEHAPIVSVPTSSKLPGMMPLERFFLDLEEAVELAKQHASSAGIIMVELDKFTAAKQNIGIASTEVALKHVGEIIEAAISAQVRISRIGSDAFVCLLDAPHDQATLLACADQICQSLASTPVSVSQHTLALTASVGVAIVDGHTPAEQALAFAEAACAVARELGGNKSHLYSPAADRNTSESIDQQWANRLREALKRDDFQLVFQPIIGLHATPGERYETLLRLRSPRGELVLPQVFLRTAKQIGLEKEIDRWVIRHALQQIKDREKLGQPVSLFTKISDASVHDASLSGWLRETIASLGADASRLTVEIDARLLMHSPAEALHFAQAAHAVGIEIALDHCDTEPECLKLFGTIPVGYWKIDGKTIARLATDRLLQVRLRKLAEAARGTGIQTIAVCVEDADTLALLWSEGVNFIQGYYVQGPEEALSYDFAATA